MLFLQRKLYFELKQHPSQPERAYLYNLQTEGETEKLGTQVKYLPYYKLPGL